MFNVKYFIASGAMLGLLAYSVSTQASAPPPPSWLDLAQPKATKRARHLHLFSLIEQEASRAGIKPEYLAVLIALETGNKPNPCAMGSVGEKGLTQVLPTTASELGRYDLFRPDHALRAGAQYFSLQLKRAKGDALTAYAAYNGGPRIFSHQLRPITQRYVRRAEALLTQAELSGWQSLIEHPWIRNTNHRICEIAFL